MQLPLVVCLQPTMLHYGLRYLANGRFNNIASSASAKVQLGGANHARRVHLHREVLARAATRATNGTGLP